MLKSSGQKTLVLSLIGLLLSGYMMCVSANDTVRMLALYDKSTDYSVMGYLSYLEDKGNSFDIHSVIAEPLQQRFVYAGEVVPNLGLAESAYWFRFSVNNPHDDFREWWVEVQDPLFDHVDIYYLRDDGGIEHDLMGDHHPLSDREIPVRNPLLNLNLKPFEIVTVYIKVDTAGSVTAPIHIWQPRVYTRHAVNLQMEYGLYFGIIAALLLYNLMLFFSTRDYTYLYYCIFVSAYSFSQFCYNGLSYEYLWPNHGYLNLPFVFLATSLYAVFMLQFTRRMIRIQELFPRLDKIMIGMMFLSAIPLLVFFIAEHSVSIRLNSHYALLSVMFVLGVGVYTVCKGVREARYFLLAWLAFLIGMIAFQLMMVGVFPANVLLLHGQQIGSALEAILLSFALAHRMKLLKDENDRMQTEAKERLEQRVSERTKELNTAMEELESANFRLKESSFNDGLTGVKNRLYFDEHYPKEWLHCRRESFPISLLMIDIDYFKSINDNFGHLAGDQALRYLTQILRNLIRRPSDIVARYGGEEFVIVLPNTVMTGAHKIAEMIRANLEESTFDFHGQKIKLTVSIGYATDHPARTDRDPDTLIDSADKALYLAKGAGRNLVAAG